MPSALCTSYLKELLEGLHQSTDVYKIALYTASASLSEATAAYSATSEVAGAGYSAGGLSLEEYTSGSSGKTAFIDWTTDPSWPASTITARYALIYNSSRSNKAVAVIDFGSNKSSTNGTFTIELPAGNSSNAIIRITGP